MLEMIEFQSLGFVYQTPTSLVNSSSDRECYPKHIFECALLMIEELYLDLSFEKSTEYSNQMNFIMMFNYFNC